MSNGTLGLSSKERKPEQPPTPEFSRQEGEQRIPIRREGEPGREVETERPRPEEQRVQPPPEVEGALPSGHPPRPAVGVQTKDPLIFEIENILEQDLGAVYQQLSESQKTIVRREGEQSASLIRILLEQVKVKAKSVLDVIRRWLRLIPGINKFFLEQEAKIKTDKVMNLHDRIHRTRS